MSGTGEGIDIRAPLGGLFSLLGAMLAGYGVAARPVGTNVNLWWGLVMLAFGLVLLAMTRRAARRST